MLVIAWYLVPLTVTFPTAADLATDGALTVTLTVMTFESVPVLVVPFPVAVIVNVPK